MNPFKLALELASGIAHEVQAATVGLRGRRTSPRATTHRGLGPLVESAEVLFDRFGVPHIYAHNAEDAFVVQGFLHAADRLFQMDLLRRLAAGRLAETVGERPLVWQDLTMVRFKGLTTVDLDHFLRAVDLPGAARKSLSVLEPGTQRILARYAEGVNAYLEMHRHRLPVEHQILGMKPESWKPEDSIALYKVFAFQMALSWRTKLTFDELARRMPDRLDAIRALFPNYAPTDECIARFGGAAGNAAALAQGGLAAFTGWSGAHVGSNSIVLSGRRSVTGRPLVANDPHLPMQAPTLFYQAHLCAGDLDVTGLGGAGIPGIAIGHNNRIAWAITHAYIDDADVYVEELDERGWVRRPDGFAPPIMRTETIRIKGKKSVERRTRVTANGPIVSDLMLDLSRGQHGAPGGFADWRQAARLPAPSPKTSRVYSLRWTGSEPGADLDAYLGFDRAQGWDEFRAAARKLHTPAWNVSYADNEGHIGYQLGGMVPLAGARRTLGVRAGWLPEHAWTGALPFDELPWLYDPAAGYVVTANNKFVDDSYPHYLSDFFEPPYRARRMTELILGRPRHDVADLRRLQLDVRSLWAGGIVDKVLRPFAQRSCSLDIHVDGALAQVAAWDGEADAGSSAAAIFYTFMRAFTERLLVGELGHDLAMAYLEVMNESLLPLDRILDDSGSPWFSQGGDSAAAQGPRGRADGRLGRAQGYDRESLITDAMADAVGYLRDRFGDDTARWRWGALHTLTHRHPLAAVPALGRLVTIGPFESGGDGTTVCNTEFSMASPFQQIVGAAARLVIDVGNWDRSTIVLSTGQSGRPLSPNYRDQAELYRQGRLRPWPYSRPAVEDNTARRTVFKPARG